MGTAIVKVQVSTQFEPEYSSWEEPVEECRLADPKWGIAVSSIHSQISGGQNKMLCSAEGTQMNCSQQLFSYVNWCKIDVFTSNIMVLHHKMSQTVK